MMRRSLIVGLVGLAGSGKSTVTEMILKYYEFKLVHLGDRIRDLVAKEGLASTPENERKLQMSIRESHGMAALMTLSIPAIQRFGSAGDDILIDSMCSFSEKEALQSVSGDCVVHIVAVHAPSEKRKVHLQERLQRPLSIDQMNDRDLLELERLEKGKLLALADHHLVNKGAPYALEKEVTSLMKAIGATKKSLRS